MADKTVSESSDTALLLETFKRFAVHGDHAATGRELNGKNWAKLCKDCHITDAKNISSTDVDIVFSKVKVKTSRVITFEEFIRALEDLAPRRFKGQSKEEAFGAMSKLLEGKGPNITGVTKATRGGATDRLTDTTKYTGAHRQRFDESGKGKGRGGREDLVEKTGYVASYKNAGTYEDKVKNQ